MVYSCMHNILILEMSDSSMDGNKSDRPNDLDTDQQGTNYLYT